MKALLLICLFLHLHAFAQEAEQPWPRAQPGGRIAFRGQLRWPDTTRTEAQRQALVRRWYRSKLTNNTLAEIRQLIQTNGTTYAGIPTESCYKFSIMNRDEEHFALCFELHLSSDNTGLAYELVDFECRYFATDNGSSFSLEEVLQSNDAREQSIMARFHSQLLFATKNW